MFLLFTGTKKPLSTPSYLQTKHLTLQLLKFPSAEMRNGQALGGNLETHTNVTSILPRMTKAHIQTSVRKEENRTEICKGQNSHHKLKVYTKSLNNPSSWLQPSHPT